MKLCHIYFIIFILSLFLKFMFKIIQILLNVNWVKFYIKKSKKKNVQIEFCVRPLEKNFLPNSVSRFFFFFFLLVWQVIIPYCILSTEFFFRFEETFFFFFLKWNFIFFLKDFVASITSSTFFLIIFVKTLLNAYNIHKTHSNWEI